MRYAVKINITEFTKPTPEDPYISFIRGTAQRISEYFLNFIGCKDYIPPAQSTNEMIEAVRDYMSSINYDTETRRNIESQILGYCVSQRKSNKPVYLSAISELVDPTNSEALIIHINDNNIMCSDVFEADPTTLRKLKRYEYRSKKWSLSFDHDLYEGKTITYDKDAKTITIRNVPEDFERTLDLKKNETTNP
ncbi:nucleoid-associated protein [Cellvibrio polysaccharolyticus]|uniref:Nucleoid-associated protein n=1 Tax=Cellvibrio polysaccharolyticus TaxID=2082724 RepID=A0A928V5Q7_9GAMM|nr:nucleoid-associated protein [Cellvibrio polysaccharolyticus]MBE8717069.1 hypothetical protein [Cellvibrio polysaccharolyticus]